MKKMLSLMMIVSLLFVCAPALAEMGVQLIGGPDMSTEPVSLDDIQLQAVIDIPGFGQLTPTEFSVIDYLCSYGEGRNNPDYYQSYISGNEAEYVILRFDIINSNTKSVDYLSDYAVKVVFDDTYEYAGWAYQYNYNNVPNNYNEDTQKATTNFVVNPADQFLIDPMYAGHYVFGCTLPNAIINSTAPLRMEIRLGENELTYNIRK